LPRDIQSTVQEDKITMLRILISVLVIASFAAPLSAQESVDTLQQIKKSGKIRIGYRQSMPPMSFMGKEGLPVGYSIDLCTLIVSEAEKALGSDINIEYVQVSSEDRLAALPDNKIDILCGATTKTISRGEIVDFTQLTFVTGASFMALKETKIRNNFEGKKIGVSKGTTTAKALEKLFEEAQIKAKIVLMGSKEEALKALDKGKIDAFAADQVVLIGLALLSDHPGNYTVLPDLFSYEPFALAVRRNDADFRLVADRAISALYRSKKILGIYDKWFGEFAKNRSPAFDALIQINAIPE
jgi:glutamate/aspartate transport system substrate-binding protein